MSTIILYLIMFWNYAQTKFWWHIPQNSDAYIPREMQISKNRELWLLFQYIIFHVYDYLSKHLYKQH